VVASQTDSKERNHKTDHASESSSLIKQNINRVMNNVFPDKKEPTKPKGKLGEVQAKAQLDALKRFIQSMESEIVEKKHKAQEARSLNNKFDSRKHREDSKRRRELR
jgi:hypothetical protein